MEPEMASTKTLVLTYAIESKPASIISHDIESVAPTLVEQASIRSYTQTIASRDSLLASLREAAAEKVVFEPGPIPDGGYAWVIVLCQFFRQVATWGMMMSTYVFISWFQAHHTFPTSPIQYAWIVGLAVSSAFFISPIATYLCKLLPLRVNLAISQIILSLGFILAGFSSNIWQLTLTQGLMCGIGLGLNFMATQPLIPQWFQIHRAVAMGLSTAGVGAGGLIFILTTRLALANHGVRFAYVMNGIITFVILTPTTIFLRPRMHVLNAKFKFVHFGLLKNPGLVFLSLWAFFVMFGYQIPLLSVATYATQGIGLSQAQGASIQAALAAGQLIGRPVVGLLMDRFGRVNMGCFITLLSGLSCLCIWMFATSYEILILFGLVNGLLSGIFFSALAPLLSEVVGLKDFSDSLSIIWITTAPIILTAAPITFALNEYSQSVLGRTGPAIYYIGIGLAGGVNILAAISLFIVRWFQNKEED